MKKAIVIGATSGIGRELAKVLAQNDYAVGIAGRRGELLLELQKEIPAKTYARRIDIARAPEAMNLLNELIAEMSGADLIIISAGIGYINPDLNWDWEKETIDINVAGFTAMADVAFKHFRQQGSGHLVGISSIGAIRGAGEAPAYNASKAFMSNYLQGLRHKSGKLKLPIIVTDIQAGLVDTAMAKGEGLFWLAPPAKAAQQIFNAIKHKRKHAYITKRWRLIAWLLKLIPDWLYNKL